MADIFKPRQTIPAADVGMTLTISEEALKEIERLNDEAIKEMLKLRDFVWR